MIDYETMFPDHCVLGPKDDNKLWVQPTLVSWIGLNETIFLQELHLQIQNPEVSKSVDGQMWFKCSLNEWKRDHFPFWHVNTINRTIKTLTANNLISSRSDLNSCNQDRTKWYSIGDDVIESIRARESLVDIEARSNDAIDRQQEEKETEEENKENIVPILDRPRQFVYLAYCTSGHYKIGISRDPEKRAGQLNRGGAIGPYEVKMIHVIESDFPLDAEAYLHEKFADCQVRGEWFDLSEKDVAWIKGIKNINYETKLEAKR